MNGDGGSTIYYLKLGQQKKEIIYSSKNEEVHVLLILEANNLSITIS